MKELIRQLGEYINNYSHCKIIETIYYILCYIVYKDWNMTEKEKKEKIKKLIAQGYMVIAFLNKKRIS